MPRRHERGETKGPAVTAAVRNDVSFDADAVRAQTNLRAGDAAPSSSKCT